MATPFDRMASLGLLSPQDKQSAALNGLLVLASQLANRGAPRLNPTPPPIDLSKAMNVYQTGMRNAMAQNMTVRKLEQEDRLQKVLSDPKLYQGLPESVRSIAPALALAAPKQVATQLLSRPRQQNLKPVLVGDAKEPKYLSPSEITSLQQQGTSVRPYKAPSQNMNVKAYIGPGGKVINLTSEQVLARQGEGETLVPFAQSQNMQNRNYMVDGEYQLLTPVEARKLIAQGKEVVPYKANARPLQSKPVYNERGQYIGEYSIDTATSAKTVTQSNTSGQSEVVPFNPAIHKVGTRGEKYKQALSSTNMAKLDGALDEAENALKQIDQYMDNLGNTNQGLQRFVDRISGQLKTAFQQGLTQEEIKLAISRGQLQALLGRFRVEVVGPGVMTEYDALRVVTALGGNPDSLQNKQVAMNLLKGIRARKMKAYKTDLRRYNVQQNRFYQDTYDKREMYRGAGATGTGSWSITPVDDD